MYGVALFATETSSLMPGSETMPGEPSPLSIGIASVASTSSLMRNVLSLQRERATHRALKDLRAPFPKSKEPYFFKGTNAVKQVLQEELQLSTEELLSSQEEDRRRARKARQTGEEEVSPGF